MYALASMSITVVMPVGPGEEEAVRCQDTARSLLAWEPEVRWLVLVDDDRSDRRLAQQLNGGEALIVSLPHPLGGHRCTLQDRVAAAVLFGLSWAARNTTPDHFMKLDTDALVIAPFARKLARATENRQVGLVGSYDTTCTGEPRDFTPWVGPVKRAGRLLDPIAIASRRSLRARRFILEARAAGYQWGEHALGCSLAMPRRVIDSWLVDGTLDDPCVFVGTRLFDDPILALLVRRAGYTLAGDVSEGQTFGVAWRGLPASPAELAARGYSIIHSVKNDRTPEGEIREHFGTLRAANAQRA